MFPYLRRHHIRVEPWKRGGAVRPVEAKGVEGPARSIVPAAAPRPPRTGTAVAVAARACLENIETTVTLKESIDPSIHPQTQTNHPPEAAPAAVETSPRPCFSAGWPSSSRSRSRLGSGGKWPQGKKGTTREASSQSVSVIGGAAVAGVVVQVGQAAVEGGGGSAI